MPRPRRRTSRWVLFGVGAMVVVPMVVALVVLREPRWYPGLELAQTELHVRDVGTSDTPLTGLVGRLGEPGEAGSHPGPLGFMSLAPVYRLAGSTPWALQVATAVLHLAAVGAAVWISHRRGGRRLAIVVTAFLTALLRFYGPGVLTDPWNPFLPVLWWAVFVLAVWSVIEDDLAMLPIVVGAGSLCVQAHVSYVGLVGGLGGCAIAAVSARLLRGPRRPAAGWLGASAALGGVLWVAPAIEQARPGRGNLSVLVSYFRGAPEGVVGLRQATVLLVANLDPWRLLVGHADPKVVMQPPSWSVGGLLFLGMWVTSAVVAWRLGERSLLRFHALLAVAVGLGAFSLSRVFGFPWEWLMLWAAGLTALIAVAIVWTASGLIRERWGPPERVRLMSSVGLGALAVLALVSSTVSTREAADLEVPDAATSSALRHLVPATLGAITSGNGLDGGAEGRYLVTWTDPVGVVGDLQGFGLVNELDRAGIAVAIEPDHRLRAAPYLTDDASTVTAVVRVVTGPAIATWEERDGTRLVVMHDPRTPEQQVRQARLRREVDEELRVLGLEELLPLLDISMVGAVFQLSTDPRVPTALVSKLERSLALGVPSAVFLEPVAPVAPDGGATSSG